MPLNISALIQGASTIAAHPITKGSSIAALISGGLYAASFAGILIPSWAFAAGPLVGLVVYKLLPKKIQDEADDLTVKIVDVVTTIPTATPDYNIQKNGAVAVAPVSQGQDNGNINKG